LIWCIGTFPLKRPARCEKNTSNMTATVGDVLWRHRRRHMQVLYTRDDLVIQEMVVRKWRYKITSVGRSVWCSRSQSKFVFQWSSSSHDAV
jgi:hypothetical protein